MLRTDAHLRISSADCLAIGRGELKELKGRQIHSQQKSQHMELPSWRAMLAEGAGVDACAVASAAMS